MKLEKIRKIYEKHNLKCDYENTILIAGTNGKGTTVNLLRQAFYKLGYKVGSFTSPHIYSEYERIKINNENISQKEFNKIYEEFKSYDLSFFEKYYLIALRHFKNENVDIVLLETGIGGLLDVVSTADAKYAIITSISYDHQDMLGDTLEKIAYEKAGICKGDRYCIYNSNVGNLKESISKFTKNAIFADYEKSKELAENLGYKYEYQIRNLSNVKKLLNMYGVDDKTIASLLKGVFEKFRQQEFEVGKFKLIVDVAHNEDSFLKLIEFVNDKYRDFKKIYIMSMLETKDLKKVYSMLEDNSDKIYVYEMPDVLHGRTKENILSEIDISEKDILKIKNNLNEEIENIMDDEKAVYVLCGSFYFVSQYIC